MSKVLTEAAGASGLEVRGEPLGAAKARRPGVIVRVDGTLADAGVLGAEELEWRLLELGFVDVKVADDADLERAAEALGAEASIDADHARISLPVTTGAEDLVTAVKALGSAGITVVDIALRQPTLDDVFLTLTGHTTEWKAFDDGDEGDGAGGDGAARKHDQRKART